MAKKDKNGNWINFVGDAVPVRYVPKIEKLRDQAVEKLIKKAKKINEQLAKFRVEAFAEIEKYLQQTQKLYDVNERTAVGNKQLSNFSNNRKVEIQVAKFITLDDRLSLAKSLIDKCLTKWSEGANEKLKIVVMDAFRVDKRRQLDKEKILGLRKLDIKDADWKKAMGIIADSITVVSKKEYIRFSQKNEKGEYKTIPLDIANC